MGGGERVEHPGQGGGRRRGVDHGDGVARRPTPPGPGRPRAVRGATIARRSTSPGPAMDGYRSVRGSDHSHGCGTRPLPSRTPIRPFPDGAPPCLSRPPRAPTPIVLDADGNPRAIRPALDWKAGADREWSDIRYETAIGGSRHRDRHHRQDHDRPARGAQRLPAHHALRAARRLRDRPQRPRGRGDRPHRGGAGGVLLRWRPAHPGRRRLRGRRRHRPAQRARPPDRDPAPSQARRRDGGRVRDRWRPHPPHRVRPHRRRRQRPLRPDRPARRLVRRRVRLGSARPVGRTEEGARDLVPVPAVQTRRKRSTWG